MKRKFETQINIKAADYSISYSQATSSDGTFSDIDDSFASALEQVNNSFLTCFTSFFTNRLSKILLILTPKRPE